MNESENQFSFTRAASSTSGRAPNQAGAPKTKFLSVMMLLTTILVFSGLVSVRAGGLVITRIYTGGTPPTNSIGGGNLEDNFNAACDVLELIFPNGPTFNLTLKCGWASVGGGQHTLIQAGGVPYRETSGEILFNNDNVYGHYAYDIDTMPLVNTNVPLTEQSATVGAFTVNVSRFFYTYTTNAQTKLFSSIIHEGWHSLGMSFGNTNFVAESADGFIDVMAPLPFAGLAIPLQYNNYGVVSHIQYLGPTGITLGSGSFYSGLLVMPDVISILADAQISQFPSPNFNLVPRLKVSPPFKVQSDGKTTTKVTLSWIQPLGGTYAVQQYTDLSRQNWSPVSVTQEIISYGIYTATVPVTGGSAFFRLVQAH